MAGPGSVVLEIDFDRPEHGGVGGGWLREPGLIPRAGDNGKAATFAKSFDPVEHPRDERGRFIETVSGALPHNPSTRFVSGPEDLMELPSLDKERNRVLSIVYNPKTKHLGVAAGASSHENLLDGMGIGLRKTDPLLGVTQDTRSRDAFSRVTIFNPKSDQQAIDIVPPFTKSPLEEKRFVGAVIQMLERKGIDPKQSKRRPAVMWATDVNREKFGEISLLSKRPHSLSKGAFDDAIASYRPDYARIEQTLDALQAQLLPRLQRVFRDAKDKIKSLVERRIGGGGLDFRFVEGLELRGLGDLVPLLRAYLHSTFLAGRREAGSELARVKEQRYAKGKRDDLIEGPSGKMGVWRTIRGRKVFIEEGQSLEDALAVGGAGKARKSAVGLIYPENFRTAAQTAANNPEGRGVAGWWIRQDGHVIDVTEEGGPGDHMGFLLLGESGEKFGLTAADSKALKLAYETAEPTDASMRAQQKVFEQGNIRLIYSVGTGGKPQLGIDAGGMLNERGLRRVQDVVGALRISPRAEVVISGETLDDILVSTTADELLLARTLRDLGTGGKKTVFVGPFWRAYSILAARFKTYREQTVVLPDGQELVLVDGDPGHGPCTNCGYVDETRMGVCFGCFVTSGPMRDWEGKLFSRWLAENPGWFRAGEWQAKGYAASPFLTVTDPFGGRARVPLVPGGVPTVVVPSQVRSTLAPSEQVPPTEAINYFENKAFAWKSILADDLLADIKRVLLGSITTGEPPEETYDALERVFSPYVGDLAALPDQEQTQPYRLETLVRTNSTEAFNQGRKDAFADSVADGFITGYEYSAILDTRTTQVCRFLDGKVLPPEGEKLDRLSPPRHYNCSPSPRIRIMTPFGPRRWCDLSVGDLVLTHEGRFKPVMEKIITPCPDAVPMVRLVLRAGHTAEAHYAGELVLTSEHPVLCDGRWVEIGSVRVGDKIVVPARKCAECGTLIPYWKTLCGFSCMAKRGSGAAHWARGVKRDAVRKRLSATRGERIRDGRIDMSKQAAALAAYRNRVPGWKDATVRRLNAASVKRRALATQARGAKRSMSGLESRIAWLLRKNGVRFSQQRCVRVAGRKYYLDFALSGKINVECDGWRHDQLADEVRDRRLQSKGWTVLRLSSADIQSKLAACWGAIQQVQRNHSGELEFIGVEVKRVEHFNRVPRYRKLYNLAVADDESYVANGVVAHNCRSILSAIPRTEDPAPEFINDADFAQGVELSGEGFSEQAKAKAYATGDHDFSSTQLDLPAAAQDRLRAWVRANVRPEELSPDETQDDAFHVTVLYGLHAADGRQAAEAIAGSGPVTFRLGAVAAFETNPDYDVLILPVLDAVDLRLLRGRLEKLLHTKTHAEYRPHVTLAYVKKGAGKRLLGAPSPVDGPITVDRLRFTSWRAGVGATWVSLLPGVKPYAKPIDPLKEGETLTILPSGKRGVWRTIGGQAVPIEVEKGESIPEAVRAAESGRGSRLDREELSVTEAPRPKSRRLKFNPDLPEHVREEYADEKGLSLDEISHAERLWASRHDSDKDRKILFDLADRSSVEAPWIFRGIAFRSADDARGFAERIAKDGWYTTKADWPESWTTDFKTGLRFALISSAAVVPGATPTTNGVVLRVSAGKTSLRGLPLEYGESEVVPPRAFAYRVSRIQRRSRGKYDLWIVDANQV